MEILLNLIKTNGDWVVAAVRIVLGVVLFAHGAQKLLGGLEISTFPPASNHERILATKQSMSYKPLLKRFT